MNSTTMPGSVHGEPIVNYRLIKLHLLAGAIALSLSMIAGCLYSLQFLGYYPMSGNWMLTPGHLRLVHTNMAAYGWLVNGFTGMLYYVVPRLTGKKIASDKLGELIFWVWQLILALSIGGYLTDKAQAIEWGETLA